MKLEKFGKRKRASVAALLGVLLFVLFGAADCEEEGDSSSDKDQAAKQDSYAQQSETVPFPGKELNDSLERRNQRERLLRQNETDRIGYVYILSFGKFLGYYVVQGKVSSTQSQMTPRDLTEYACDDHMSGCQAQVVEAPGDDGSYGENEDGIFFFTTEGAMVQVDTEYIYSDQPIAVGDIPELNGSGDVSGAGVVGK